MTSNAAGNRARTLRRALERGALLGVPSGPEEFLEVVYDPRGASGDPKPWALRNHRRIRIATSAVVIMKPCLRPIGPAAGKLKPMMHFVVCGEWPGHQGPCVPLRSREED